MTCPMCGAKTLVAVSVREEDIVARRRKCTKCAFIFYTSEVELKDSEEDFYRLDRVKEEKRRIRNRGAKPRCE